jgi:hypothetical protein
MNHEFLHKIDDCGCVVLGQRIGDDVWDLKTPFVCLDCYRQPARVKDRVDLLQRYVDVYSADELLVDHGWIDRLAFKEYFLTRQDELYGARPSRNCVP